MNLSQESTKSIVYNLIVTMVLAFSLEALIYLGLVYPTSIPEFLLPAFRNFYQYGDRNIVQVTPCGQYDPELFYRFRPGPCSFRNREFDVQHVNNSVGLRDDESSVENPEVVVLGDSYAMGWGVQQDDCFPQVLERLTRYSVLNAGISSYGTARELILFEKLELRNPKHIILQYHSNDHSENLRYIENGFRLPIRSLYAYDSIKNSIHERRRYYPFKNLYWVCKSIGKEILVKEPRNRPEEEAITFLKIMQHHQDKLRDIALTVFKIDDHAKLDDQFIKAVDSLLAKPDFANLNIKTLSISKELTKDDYFILDDHINSRGHQKIALKIYNDIFSEK